MLAGVTMRIVGENRQDLADVNARRLSGLKYCYQVSLWNYWENRQDIA